MNNKINETKEKLNIPIMTFCIVGTVLFVLGALLIKKNEFKLTIFATEGTISSIQTNTGADGQVQSKSVSLAYIAARSDYLASVPIEIDSNLQMGDKITVYYDFFSPTTITRKRGGYEGYIALIIGLIIMLKTTPKFIKIIKDNYL